MINEPDDPVARPGEDVKDVPEATPEVDDDAAPVPLEDSLDDPQDTVPQEPRRRSVLVKGFSAMGLSTVARRFDRQGKGELDEAEQRARDLADTQGHVRPDQAITAMELGMANEKKLNKAVRHFRLMSVLALLLLVGLFVAVFYAPDNAVAKGNAEVKEKIDESVQTDVAVDALGDPHLTDKATGKDITVKADGVVAGTTPRVLNGRKLNCISLADVASAVHGLETASTKVNLVFRDEEGLGTKITPLSDYEDNQSYLSFDAGKIRVKMDSDACDVAAALDKDDVEGVRRLGQATTLASRPGPKTKAIQAKLRQGFFSARMALREGRRLGPINYAEVAGPGEFLEKVHLQAAVNAYVSQGCASNPDCEVEATHGPISEWDVSRVTDTSSLFKGKASFNADISRWDTSSVTNMGHMFSGASVFNRPLDWDTSSVTSMNEMFRGASAFESDLSSFDTARVKSMWGMFRGASSFNGDISDWDTSSATNINRMFLDASAFDKNLCAWSKHYDSTKNYEDMFSGTSCPSLPGASQPDGQYTNWCKELCTLPFQNKAQLQRAVDAYSDQGCATNPDCAAEKVWGPIEFWKVRLITNMSELFQGKTLFNADISGWDTSSVTAMTRMFNGASSFDQDLSSWDTSSVTIMYRMFRSASSFDKDLCAWGKHYDPAKAYGEMFANTSCPSKSKPNGLFTNWCTVSCPRFPDKAALQTAVDAYVSQGCASNPDCEVEATHGPISEWDVSRITDMSKLFQGKTSFNADISGWETSSVTNMERMFEDATSFNRPLDWDTSSVRNMEGMFSTNGAVVNGAYVPGVSAFNQDLNWDTSSVTNMQSMFSEASAFNGDLSSFDTSKVTSMAYMFHHATTFNRDLSNFDTSKVTNMSHMFRGAKKFNRDLSSWDTSKVTWMDRMFLEAGAFESDLSGWDTSSVTWMVGMFERASSFSSNLCTWGHHHSTTNADTYVRMFEGSNCVNKASPSGPSTNWCAATCPNVFNNKAGLQSAVNAFISGGQHQTNVVATYGPISEWDVSRVTDMSELFKDTGFDSAIDGWDTSSVTDMSNMFFNANAFNQNLCSWKFHFRLAKDYTNMFAGTSCPSTSQPVGPCANWCRATCWCPSTGTPPFPGKTELQTAVDDYINQGCATTPGCAIENEWGPIESWNVGLVADMSSLFEGKDSFDEDLSNWDTSSVTDMSRMFKGASAFKGTLSSFDTSSVTTMQGMFNGASSFNRDLSGFNTSSVTTMNSMFNGASAFDRDVSNFDTSKVTNMAWMFGGASAFDRDISGWDTSSVAGMRGMFKGAGAFNQDLCAWGVDYPHGNYNEMFVSSNCPSTSEPTDASTNWCKATCP